MTRQSATQTQQTPTTSLLSRGGILQRKCESCGQHTIAGGECMECGKQKSGLQRKLTIGASNDPLEREADQVADQVMAASAHPAVSDAPPRIQRFTGQTGQADIAAPASVDRVLSSPGRPLEPVLQQDMGQRFGHDFSRVRVHTDAAAERSARDVNAIAYTVGHHIVFGAGQFAPSTSSGRHLLAHELTHTIQQGAPETLRRRTDYDIIDLNPNAASEPSSLYFDFGSATLAHSEQLKIAALASPPTRALTLFGYASEEGTAAARTAITNRRLAAVDKALRAAGHTGRLTRMPDITRGEGQIDYRRMRVVEVVPTPVGGGAAVPSHGSGVCNPVEPCGTNFNTAHSGAVTQLNTTINAVQIPTPAATAQLATLFPGIPTAQVLTGLQGLAAELTHMVANHQCHNACDSNCSRPAYATPSTRMMTLCPGFLTSTSLDENVLLLLHEGLHMVPGLRTVDTAYRRSRYIDFLSGMQAATNTDSFVLLIVRLSSSAAAGPPVDPVGGLAPVEQTAARRALAYAEQWMLTCDWDTSQLYESIKANKGRAGGWDPTHNYHAGTQHVIGWIFGLTDPGAAPPFTTPPTQSDQEKVAGIHDRYNRFMYALWTRPIIVTNSAAGPETWDANLGSSVVVTPAFFGLGAAYQVLRLIELMAASLPTSDVPTARQRDYATAAQQIWWHAGRFGP